MPQRDRKKQKLGRPSQRSGRGAPQKKRRAKMKTKLVLALAALSYAPQTVAGDKDVYPKERVAEFILEKLDVTSLPAAMRPKPSSKRWVARGSCRSRFSTRDPPESMSALPSRGKLPVRRRCKV